jgi:hypothetical protein
VCTACFCGITFHQSDYKINVLLSHTIIITFFYIIELDQHAELDFYSASSLKQPSAGWHVAPLGHIILIQSQPVFALHNLERLMLTFLIIFSKNVDM